MGPGRGLKAERGRGRGVEEGTAGDDGDMRDVGIETVLAGCSSSAASESRLRGTCACLLADTLADDRQTGAVGGSTGPAGEADGARWMVSRRWTRMLRVFCLAGVVAQLDGPFADLLVACR